MVSVSGLFSLYYNLFTLSHWIKTNDEKVKLGVFTSPSISSKWSNLNSKLNIAFGLKFIGINDFAQGLNPIVVGVLVCAIGISWGQQVML